MAKAAVKHACTECGYSTGRWLGRCPDCGSWGSLVEERVAAKAMVGGPPLASARPLLKLVEVEATDAERLPTGVPELDRVLGGGLVPASLVLVSGDPGIGKSTLLLMALRAMSRDRSTLLVTGEESAAQVKLRADRLGGGEAVHILAETNLAEICATLEAERPEVCVIDSVQTLYDPELGSAPGSVAQVREAAARLLRVAKENGVATFLVGHVTKDGSVAGPRVLEHLVDCVLQFEGDRYREHRVLRAVKNRFGSTNELGVFEMTSDGLVGVADPSELFGRSEGEVGSAVTCALEGSRPLLLEIQALVSPTDLAMPRRVGTGVDPKRLSMIVAVLGRHAKVALGQADVFVNVAGGVRIDEPGADLGIALAIASAARGTSPASGLGLFGEVGLTGRLRPASQAERRLAECVKLGLSEAVVSAGSAERGKMRIRAATTLSEAIRWLSMRADPRKDRKLMSALGAVAPGTALRAGIDDIIRAELGALIVIGEPSDLAFLFSGGMRLDLPFTAQLLYELAKMDGAIIINSDNSKLVYANVQLMPDSTIASAETGTRHRTAERVAKQTDAIVISISQQRETVTLFYGELRYQLGEISDTLARTNQALATLETYRSRLEQGLTRLTALEFQSAVMLDDILVVLQRAEMTTRMADEIERNCVELGEEGRLIRMQLDELMEEVPREKAAVVFDYELSGDTANAARILEKLAGLPYQRLLEVEELMELLGYPRNANPLDQTVAPRGYRVLSHIPRLPDGVIRHVVKDFESLDAVVRASHRDLEAVDGVGSVRAREIREGLRRLQEHNLVDRYLQM